MLNSNLKSFAYSDSLTLIPCITAYLIHYFYISKTRDDCKKRNSNSESASKNTLKEKMIKFLERY